MNLVLVTLVWYVAPLIISYILLEVDCAASYTEPTPLQMAGTIIPGINLVLAVVQILYWIFIAIYEILCFIGTTLLSARSYIKYWWKKPKRYME